MTLFAHSSVWYFFLYFAIFQLIYASYSNVEISMEFKFENSSSIVMQWNFISFELDKQNLTGFRYLLLNFNKACIAWELSKFNLLSNLYRNGRLSDVRFSGKQIFSTLVKKIAPIIWFIGRFTKIMRIWYFDFRQTHKISVSFINPSWAKSVEIPNVVKVLQPSPGISFFRSSFSYLQNKKLHVELRYSFLTHICN